MGKYAQLVMGPAGSGKSTYTRTIVEYCHTAKRTVHIINLDPAAEYFEYKPSVDIRDLISLTDVMEEMKLGPNGGLVFCFEYLLENMDWLEEELGDYQDDYLIFDCPGQIELYTHIPVMRRLVDSIQRYGYRMCGVYLLDSQFLCDASRFMSGALLCLSAMIQLELPHVNVITKMDLLKRKGMEKNLVKFIKSDAEELVDNLQKDTPSRYKSMNAGLAQLLDDYSMVSFQPLDITDEESVATCLMQIDNAIQFGEDEEVQDLTQEYPDEFDFDKLQSQNQDWTSG